MELVVRLSLATHTSVTTYLGLLINRLREWVDVVTEAINEDRG